MSNQQPSSFARRVGANVQKLRSAAGLSQTELAHQLQKSGFSFQQQTVLKVEKGQRPLKLDEAVALANVLAVPIERLWDDEFRVEATALVQGYMRNFREARDQLTGAGYEFEKARYSLETALEAFRHKGVPNDVVREADGLLGVDPQAILNTAVREHRLNREKVEARLEAGASLWDASGRNGK